MPWNLAKPVKTFSCNHCTSTPHRSETHGIAESTVRRVKEGTSAVLLQSRLGHEWWADSMECHFYLRNIQDLLSDGKTPYERVLENLSKDLSFCLVHWSNITLFLGKTSRESINLCYNTNKGWAHNPVEDGAVDMTCLNEMA